MDEDRKRKEERDNNWGVGLGIAAGIAGVGLLAGLGYKVWKDQKQRKEENARTNALADWRGHSVFDDDDSDDSDTGNYCHGYATRALESPSRHRWSVFAEQRLNISEIGINFNEWRIPKKLTMSEMEIATRFCDASEKELDISDEDWKKAKGAVDKVLGLLMIEIKESEKYEGLVIETYIKQGSSREGLKVYAADEFDVLLQYRIENLQYEVENISSSGNILPELAYLRVDSTMGQLSQSHPRLHKKGVFTEKDGKSYINTRNLQEKVFTSMIASASSVVQRKVNQGEYRDKFEFKIKVRNNPPSVNIGIELTDDDDGSGIQRLQDLRFESQGALQVAVQSGRGNKTKTVIDVDIVPGLLLSEDRVPDPTNSGQMMRCPVYAVFKWLTENHRSVSRYAATPSLLWRICSSGYEKHVIDVAQGKNQQKHIVNALRFLKLYFRNMKRNAIERGEPPPQVVTVLRSYHLKHIALYCILFLRVLNDVQVSDVDRALSYMLAFLGVCLDERKLPHFFHANKNITRMFPDFNCKPRSMRYNLLQGKVGESFNQAMRSYKKMNEKMSTVLMNSSAIEMESLLSDEIVDQFRHYVSVGEYYQ